MEAYTKSLMEKQATLLDVIYDYATRSGDERRALSADGGAGATTKRIVRIVRLHTGGLSAQLEDGTVVDMLSLPFVDVELGLAATAFVDQYGAEQVLHLMSSSTNDTIGYHGELEVKKKTPDGDVSKLKRDTGKHITAIWERISALEQAVAAMLKG
jgi:hypothetical protein